MLARIGQCKKYDGKRKCVDSCRSGYVFGVARFFLLRTVGFVGHKGVYVSVVTTGKISAVGGGIPRRTSLNVPVSATNRCTRD